MCWIQTYTGKKFYPLNPRVEDVDIRDIIHALSLKCRFTGHCSTFYSVAEHSYRVAEKLPKELKLQGLLHDATESYLPDVARPIKLAINFQAIEHPVWIAIAKKFGLPSELDPLVHETDTRMLMTEARDLMGEPPESWGVDAEPYYEDIRITPHSCWNIKHNFRRSLQLCGIDC